MGVVRLFEHRQVRQVALDARGEVLAIVALALDDGQLGLAPSAGAWLTFTMLVSKSRLGP